MPDLRRSNDTLNDIREEAETDQDNAGGVAPSSEKDKDDNSSVLSTSSRSMRFRVPSLRRRITDNSSTSSKHHNNYKYSDDVIGSPRSITVSAYSVGSASGRSRRASEVQSEDDAASLGPLMGLEISKDRKNDSWGVGDEVVMGLE